MKKKGLAYKDWRPQTVLIKQVFQFPLPPGFRLIPLNIHYHSNHRRQTRNSMFVEDVYPGELWDSETSTLQPQRSTYETNRTALFRLRFGDDQIVLAVGVFQTSAGRKTWCKLIPTLLFEGLARSEMVERWAPWDSRIRIRERAWNRFKNEDVEDLPKIVARISNPSFPKGQLHNSIAQFVGTSDWDKSLNLAATIEKKTLSGQEMYVIYLKFSGMPN